MDRKSSRWNHIDLKFLVSHYSDMTYEALAQELKRTPVAIEIQLRRLKLRKLDGWESSEIQTLLENYATHCTFQLSQLLNKPPGEVVEKIHSLRLAKQLPKNTRKAWSAEEITFLRKNITKMSYKQMTTWLDRTWEAINLKAQDLKIQREYSWTEEEIRTLRTLLKTMSVVDISKQMDRSYSAINTKMRDLKLSSREERKKRSLEELYPAIAAQWHQQKNGDLSVKDIIASSEKIVWWKCEEGPDHEWEATIKSRTRKKGRGCPFCAGKRVSVTNSLGHLFPEIAAQWHSSKNHPLTPFDVVAGTSKKIWWTCIEGPDHEWEAGVVSRTRQVRRKKRKKKRKVKAGKTKGCPYCAGRRVSVTNSLKILYPEVAAEWHPTKNGSINPAQVVAGTSKSYWWQCKKNSEHEWEVSPANRVRGRADCPFCTPK